MTLFPDERPIAPPSPVGLGAMMAGGGASASKTVRQPNDYYPTPPDCTRALLERELNALRASGGGRVWEPCGRGGAIMRVLAEFGFEAVGTDLVPDAANAVEPLDLMAAKRRKADAVVTNPPFALAAPMIEHLLGALGVRWCAMLLKSTFFHAAERVALFRRYPPARIWALSWRPDFLAKGAPTMECCWFVWDRGCAGLGTRYGVLTRPGGDSDDLFGELVA